MIIVSNRLPVTIQKTASGEFNIQKSSGGLVAGLREIHRQENLCSWVGHSGICCSEAEYPYLKQQLTQDRFIAVDINKEDYDNYYNGMSNRVIWPLFHYFPETIHLIPEEWQAYQRVNHQFAQAVLSIAKPGDQVWVHDYQLMLLPGLLREANYNLSIAYFHHIPFPSSELFRILAPRALILQGLLGADIIGFHTYDYMRHFLTSVTRILGCETHIGEIHYHGREVKVVVQPLGVDVEMIQNQSETAHDKKEISHLAEEIGNRTVLLGIDRLDYTKGIPERLMAFRQFLQQYPQYIGKVTLIQISVPSRTDLQIYNDLRATVERWVGQINGEFGSPGYTPVQYLYRSFTRDEIIAFYKLATIALITPLRDGLNLVSKEYVAARDDEDGVLILSEMAGAAAEMGEALIVNPYDTSSFAQAIHTALTMPIAERRHRMQNLRQRIIRSDNIAWFHAFTQKWTDATQRNRIQSTPLRGDIQNQLLTSIKKSARCFIFLDYDGTLTPITGHPEWAIPNSASKELLNTLGKLNNVELVLITGRSQNFCITHFDDLPIHLVAEHGAFIRLLNKNEISNSGINKNWQIQPGLDEFLTIEPEILHLLEDFTEHVPSSYIERKKFSLVWHYCQAEPVFAIAQARDLSTSLAQLLENTPFTVYAGKKNLEVRHIIANKGHATEQILQNLTWQSQDALITIGDDRTDEDMYKIGGSHNMAIHVGSPNFFAKYHLNSPSEVHYLLQAIEQQLQ